MSDIGSTAPPPTDAPPEEPVDAAPEIDPALLELFEAFRPLLTEFTKVAIAEAQSSMNVPTVRSGTVQLMDHTTGSAQVLVDGDTAAIPITVVCEYPIPGDRVRCTFWGEGAAFVDGVLGGCGIPPAFVMSYVGTVDGDTSSSTGTGPPRGFAWARGQVMEQNAAPGLYARVGTRFNTSGETATQFRLPDLRGRVVLGLDNMGGTDAGRLSMGNALGGTGGAESITLVTGNLPSHDHGLNSHTHSMTGVTISGNTGNQSANHSHNSPDGSSFATANGAATNLTLGGGFTLNTSAGATTTTENVNHTHSLSGASLSGSTAAATGNTATTGSGSAVTVLPPYMLCHWLVKL